MAEGKEGMRMSKPQRGCLTTLHGNLPQLGLSEARDQMGDNSYLAEMFHDGGRNYFLKEAGGQTH